MTVPFTRLLNSAKPHLPGAIEEAMRQELFMVCFDFFNNSNAWQEELTVIIPEGEDRGDVIPFSGKIARLMGATLDGTPAYGVFMVGGRQMKVMHTAPFQRVYTATVALTVADPVTRDSLPIAPQEVVEDYLEVLTDGLLARMMAQPSKPYTNLTMAQFYRIKFRSGTSRAFNEVYKGNTFGSQRWSYPRTFPMR